MRSSDGFRRIYPGENSILFDGGLNNKFERSIIEDNESPDCLNVVFTNAAVETRQGSIKLNTAAVGSGAAFDGLWTRRANDNSETMVAWAGGHMFTLATTTFVTVPSAQSVFTAGAKVFTALFQNYMFMGNGGVVPYKWNGTTFTRHGVYPPTTTSTVASNATGTLTGDYRYKVTAVNSALVESDVGPATATFTAASATIRVSSIPTFPVSHGVNARRLYRTVASGTAYKLVSTINDNTTTTYDDSTADLSLGSSAPIDNGVPPKYSVILYAANRLFMNDPDNPNFVWYTDINSGGPAPYTVPSTNFFRVGDDTSDLVKGFGIYQGQLIVYCERGPWMNYMPDSTPANWKQIKIQSPYGSKSPYCVIDYNDKQLYAAIQNGKFVGFSAIRGTTNDASAALLTIFTAGSDRKSDRIEPDMFQVQEAQLSKVAGIVYKNRAYIALTYGVGATVNNRIYVYDFSISNLRKDQEASWAPWTGINASFFTIYGGKLYAASSGTDGFVYQLESGTYDDNGSAINSYYWTKELPGFANEVNFNKDFRYANLLVENSGAWFMDLGYRVDSDSGSGSNKQISLNPGGSLWGSMVWGRDLWGGGSSQKEVRVFLDGARGKRIQFKFSNQNKVGQKFKVMKLNYAYNLKGYRG
jgi:hypothetical protein